MDSILNTVKKTLGVTPEYDVFDADIILCINTAISTLVQIGVGVGFTVIDDSETWDDYLPDADSNVVSMVKSFIGFKVRLMFDPPQSGTMNTAAENQLEELTKRISWYVDHGEE